jgi:hypothetical protein
VGPQQDPVAVLRQKGSDYVCELECRARLFIAVFERLFLNDISVLPQLVQYEALTLPVSRRSGMARSDRSLLSEKPVGSVTIEFGNLSPAPRDIR